MAIAFEFKGLQETKVMVSGAESRMRDPGPALRFIGEQQMTRNTRRLRAGVDVDGVPFKKSRREQSGAGRTLWDTGALAGSLNYAVGGKVLDFFSSDKRARVHYDGALIEPKHGKFLTIPLRASGGLFAGTSLDVKANRVGDRASHYAKKSIFFAWRHGRLFMFQKLSKGQVRALFLLVRSVRMVKRKWMGFSTDDVAAATQVLGARITGEKR